MLRLTEYGDFFERASRLPSAKQARELRVLYRSDLYALLRYGLRRADMEHPWLFSRCREVQAQPDGHLDLWPRDHRKSSIITFGLSIFDILGSHGDNPVQHWRDIGEVKIGIFSYSRTISRAFLRQIMQELQTNVLLQELFPDILYANPLRDAAKWSEMEGIIVRRRSNPKESTVEAWGVVDSQPTSKHFDVLVYDDLVTLDTVNTPDMIHKTLSSWEASLNLGTAEVKKRYIGTRWHMNDPYREILDRGAAIARLHYCTVEKEYPGTPVLLTEGQLAEKRRDMGPRVFAAQMLMDPKADMVLGFKIEWIKFHDIDDFGHAQHMNRYIIVDPASKKKVGRSFTSIVVLGLGPDMNYYWLDGIRDRLSLTQREDLLFALHGKWRPKKVGYEQYAMQTDVEHMRLAMKSRNYRFDIVELGDAQTNKDDRIEMLVPIFEQERMYIPTEMMRTNWEGRTVDVVKQFIYEEYVDWPISKYKDTLDAMSRIVDPKLNAVWPQPNPDAVLDRYAKTSMRNRRKHKGSWMVH